VKEAKDRVRSAILNSRYEFPAKRITINLAPADLPKVSKTSLFETAHRYSRLAHRILRRPPKCPR
jgi:predicted ATPase with chaperone activity